MITLDFETYSEAGFAPTEGGGWKRLAGAREYGITAVGAAVYAQHPSTEILSLSYAFSPNDIELWIPGMRMPHRLFDAISFGEEVEAHNSGFEVWIWRYVAVPKLRWPWLPLHQVRCSMARSRAYSLPGKLSEVGKVLRLSNQKDKEGDRLLKLFSVPRQPTKGNLLLRNYPSTNSAEAQKLYSYNIQDVRAELDLSARTPELSTNELSWWQVEQACNRRGVRLDAGLINGAIRVMEEVFAEAAKELKDLTHGIVESPSQLPAMQAWLRSYGLHTDSMDEEAISDLLQRGDLPKEVRRVLEIRQGVGSASIKKYYAMRRQMAYGDRLHDWSNYYGAHTGRETASDVQPQNLPKSGPDVTKCHACGHYHGTSKQVCPWCQALSQHGVEEWNAHAADDAILVLREGSKALCDRYFDSAVSILSACLRGAFIASEGHVMMGADFSAIEGVGGAMLANEPWRIEVFRTHGKIYEMAGAKLLGTTLEQILAHKQQTGKHHPIRAQGKIGELAGQFGGSVGAWKNFGADAHFPNDDAIKTAVNKWRADSPQFPLTWYALHDSFVEALQAPGSIQAPMKKDRAGTMLGGIAGVTLQYFPQEDVLRMRLPSGRAIVYHRPRLEAEEYGRPGLSYEGWNTNPKMGPYGWIRKRTFGGRLFENLVQATCRDILVHAAVNAYHAGYELCLHVHDELCVEVPEHMHGLLNAELLATIMMQLPRWAHDWPIRVPIGECWTGKRYQK